MPAGGMRGRGRQEGEATETLVKGMRLFREGIGPGQDRWTWATLPSEALHKRKALPSQCSWGLGTEEGTGCGPTARRPSGFSTSQWYHLSVCSEEAQSY